MKKAISRSISIVVFLMLTAALIMPAAAAGTVPRVFQDFESYADNSKLNNNDTGYKLNPYGDNAVFELDTQNKFSGKYGLKFTYNLAKEGYCGRQTFMPIIQPGGDMQFEDDWGGAQAIQFWLKGDTSNCTLGIVVDTSDGEVWQYNVLLNSSQPRIIRCPFREMTSRYGSTVLLEEHITSTGLYVNKDGVTATGTPTGNKGTQNTGTIYLDSFQIVKTSDPIPDISGGSTSSAASTQSTASTQSATSAQSNSKASGSQASQDASNTDSQISDTSSGQAGINLDDEDTMSNESNTPESEAKTDDGDKKGGINPVLVAVIISVILILAVGGICLYIFVLKPKNNIK